jgi:fluoride exporter
VRNLPLWIAVALLGGTASVARFVLDDLVELRWEREFPLGILLVNLSGTFAAGLLLGVGTSDDVHLLAAVGTLGSFTTFSTWMLDLERAEEQGEPGNFALNLGLSAVLGLGAAVLGRAVGRLL